MAGSVCRVVRTLVLLCAREEVVPPRGRESNNGGGKNAAAARRDTRRWEGLRRGARVAGGKASSRNSPEGFCVKARLLSEGGIVRVQFDWNVSALLLLAGPLRRRLALYARLLAYATKIVRRRSFPSSQTARCMPSWCRRHVANSTK